MLREARSAVTWSLNYGLPRAMFKKAARRGDLMSRLELEPALLEDPFPTYEEFRARGRLVLGTVMPVTVDHAISTAVLRSPDFGVAAGQAGLPHRIRRVLEAASDPWSAGPVDPPSMLVTDPPDHTRYRRLVSRAFTVRTIEGLEPMIQATADQLLDRVESSDSFDVVEQFAALLPVAVIARMLGVPDHMHRQLLEWGNGAAVTLDPALTWRRYRKADRDVRNLHAWFAEHIRSVRREPRDDLISRLANLEGDDRLTDIELRATGLLLLGAGFETTVNLIGNAVRVLDQHPDQLRRLQDDPSGWGNAVEEVLRYDSPVQLTLRQAYVDTEVDGVPVPEGQPVLTYLGGANRDPAVFADPQTFDVTRSDAGDHLAFSSGIHYCLGAGLARLEATVALRTLYERRPDLRLSGPPVRRDTRVLRGYEHLPVSSDPERKERRSHEVAQRGPA
ncbi:MAG: cytochrome P450 [Actinomycetota bacterium]|nr:cytochrome P450 [Actinomycetota bacterium]